MAVAWPDRNASVEYFTIIKGMQPVDQTPPAQAVLDAVAAAQNLLYIKDANGNFIGYTPLYTNFRRNQPALADARAAQAMAYAQAMADPVAGQQWPIVAQTYANKVTQALNDFNSMGARQVQDALDIIATQGERAVTALAAMARQMWQAFQVQLSGGISSNVPWSYISPISWWDYTDNSSACRRSPGRARRTTRGPTQGRGRSQTIGSVNSRRRPAAAAESTSASPARPPAGVTPTRQTRSPTTRTSRLENESDVSSASVTMEFFIATCERTWSRRYFQHQGMVYGWPEAKAISDGTIDNQIGDKSPAILPMLPKGFLVIRNVSIKCDDWGDFGDLFNQAMQASQASGQSSSNSVAVQASYLFYSASGQHQDQQSSGAFGSQQTTSGFTFTSDGKRGGNCNCSARKSPDGSAKSGGAPLMDDPTLPKDRANKSPQNDGWRSRGCRGPTGDLRPWPGPTRWLRLARR